MRACFTTLWIYTILKLQSKGIDFVTVLLPYGFTLFSNSREYIRKTSVVLLPYGFTLFSNVALSNPGFDYSFTTLWIYTILKHNTTTIQAYNVSLPYGFTLFSNESQIDDNNVEVLLPYGFTLFSNLSAINIFLFLVLLPYGFTLFSNCFQSLKS